MDGLLQVLGEQSASQVHEDHIYNGIDKDSNEVDEQAQVECN